jgi:arylsulfatase A-like enzyme
MASATGTGSRLRGGARGVVLGAIAGACWAAVELGVNWAAGATAPRAVVQVIGGLDLGVAAAVGLVAGVCAPGIRAWLLGLVLLVAYALARVVSLPNPGSELAVLVGGALLVGLAARFGPAASGGLLAVMHMAVLGALALLAGELWLDGPFPEVLRGVWLPVVCLGLPAAAIVADAALGMLVRSRRLRFAAEVTAVAVAAGVLGAPLDTRPLLDPVITGVPPPAGSPDVVLISLDTMRADRLSTYGYERETSPNLTRLAAEGVLYRRARSPAGWTLPAHASMMTGLFPRSHGAHLAGGMLPGESMDGRPQVAYPLRADVPTLAELLRDRGYETGAFVANFSYLYRDYGLARGFGIYDDAPGLLVRVRPPLLRVAQQLWPSFGRKPFRTAADVNREALAWLDGRGPDRPVFLFLNYMEPHQPWIADRPYDRWAADVPGAAALARKNLYTHAVRQLSPETVAFIGAHYDGQVAAMDAALGDLLAALRARGRYANTLVIVTADHGELLGEHGEMGHMGRMLYEPLLHVPLVVKRPRADAARVVDQPVQLVDLVPTVAEAVGIPAPAGVEGRPLDDGAPRDVYAEEGINPFLVARYGSRYDRGIRVVYEGPYKLISTSRGDRHLFDLEADPGEQTDLASREPARVQALTQRLELHAPRLAAAESDSTEKVR